MSQLAQALERYTGRIVLDQTELTGGFDYDLEFEADPALLGRSTGGGISIFAAVQQQLGLRLDSRRAPVDVLVIDSAEQPQTDPR